MSIALVTGQHAVNSGSAVTLATAYPGSVTAGNLLIAGFAYNRDLLFSDYVITDTRGNTWLSAAYQHNVGPQFGSVGIFYCIANGSGANTLTVDVTVGGADGNWLGVAEFSGASTHDQDAAFGNGTSTSPASADATITASDELLIGIVFGQGTQTATNSFTMLDSLSNFGFSYRIVSSIAAYHAAFTQSINDVWGCGMSSFIQSGPTPAYNQHSFRFVNDDGIEAASTFAKGLNTNDTVLLDTNKRIRLLTAETDT